MHNVKLSKSWNLHFRVVDPQRVMNQFIKTSALWVYDVNWVFFVDEDSPRKHSVLIQLKHVDVSDVCEVALHLIGCNSLKIHHTTNHGFFLSPKCAVEELAQLGAPCLLSNWIPRLDKLIQKFEVLNSHNQFLLKSGSYRLNLENLELLCGMNPIKYTTHHTWLLFCWCKEISIRLGWLVWVWRQCWSNRVLTLSVKKVITFYQNIGWVSLLTRVRKSIIINHNWILTEAIICIY